jgi:hypothetical protein
VAGSTRKKTPFWRYFYAKKDQFTKTDSGQTRESTQKRDVFSDRSRFSAVITKAWTGLATQIHADGIVAGICDGFGE